LKRVEGVAIVLWSFFIPFLAVSSWHSVCFFFLFFFFFFSCCD
jgi:hypothetical protein